MTQIAARPEAGDFQEIVQKISQRIQQGKYMNANKLPSVRALAQAYDISPRMAMKVLRELEARNLAIAKARSGYYAKGKAQSQSKLDSAKAKDNKYIYQTVVERFVKAISNGAFAHDGKFPSVREMMVSERISQATAMRVMVELEKLGLIFARARSGFFVRLPEHQAVDDDAHGLGVPQPTTSSAQAEPVEVVELIQNLFAAFRNPKLIALGAAEIGKELLPATELFAARQRADRKYGPSVFSTQDPLGVRELRQALARLALKRGLSVPVNDIIITAGETDAMALALRALTAPGDAVAVESPTYFGILQEIEVAGLRAVEIATDPTSGINVDELIHAADTMSIKAVILNPIYQNPFGCCMPAYALRTVAEAMAQRGIPIIEDDVYSELSFKQHDTRPLASFDLSGNTIYCASYSKVLSPGLRVGWCVPGRYKAQILARRARHATVVSSIAQYTLAEYLAGRRLYNHTARLCRIFEQQQEEIRGIIKRHFPSGTKASAPRGGFLYWVEIPPPFDAMQFYVKAIEAGISIAPGPLFSASGRFSNAFRISLGRKLTPVILRALEKLGQLAREAMVKPSDQAESDVCSD